MTEATIKRIEAQVEEAGLDFEIKQTYIIRATDGEVMIRTTSVQKLNDWWTEHADEELAISMGISL